MARTSLLVAAIAVGCYVLVHLIVTTEPERVEAEVERLLGLARRGGEDAAEEILDAFAEDYSGSFELDWIQKQVRNYVGRNRFKSVTVGSFSAVWKGDDILIPRLTVTLEVEGWKAVLFLAVTCAERDGEWKIVHVTRLRWG